MKGHNNCPLVALAILLTAPSLASAQQTDSSIDYALHGVAFGTAVAYSHTKYGPLRPETRGGRCFLSARTALSEAHLEEASVKISQKCHDPSTLSSCITPEMSDLAYRILALFEAKRL